MVDAGGASIRWLGTWCAAVMLGSGFGSAPALAGELDAGAGYSLAYDSNIHQAATPVADETQAVIAGFSYVEHTLDLHAQMLGQGEWRDYVHGELDPNSAYYFNGAVLWTITPRQFFWSINDVARQVRINPAAADVPANRTNTNSLGTGPDYTVRLTRTDTAAFGGRYGRFDTKGAAGDNERYSAYARGLRQLGAYQALSVNYEATRVFFSDPTVLYQRAFREDLFMRLDSRIASTNSINVDLGATRVQRKGGRDVRGQLARLTLTRRITPTSTGKLSLADQFSDPYIDLLAGVTSATVPTEGAPATPDAGTIPITDDLYRGRRGQLSYSSNDGRIQYLLRAYIRTFDFEINNQNDQKEQGGQLEWYWRYLNAAQLYVYAGYLKRTFLDSGLKDREKDFTLGVTYKVSRNVAFTAQGGRIERETGGTGFVDNRAMLLLGYSTGPLYTVRTRR